MISLDQLTGITVLWPRLLWLLVLLPILAVLYLRLAEKKRRSLAHLPGLWHSPAPQSKGSAIRRIIPLVLLLLGLFALLAAVSRPQAILTLPLAHKDIILAIDTSGSMRAADVTPDRLTAAKNAARAFIEKLPSRTRVGIVSVASNATLIQSPTSNREDLMKAIERVQLQRGSALGSGIYVSLATLLPDAGIKVEQLIQGFPDSRMYWPPGSEPDAASKTPKPPPGSNRSAAMILLSDGENNFGPEPLEAANLAAEHGVRIHIVGIGSSEGIALTVGGWSMRVSLDEETLRKIAETTLGEYYTAGSAQDLQRIHEHLSARIAISRASTVEITAFFVVFGALLLAVSALCSMLWFSRVA